MSDFYTAPNGKQFPIVGGSRPRNDAAAPAIASSKPSSNKYRNVPVFTVNGARFSTRAEAKSIAKVLRVKVEYFASTAEADRHDELVLLERGGKIGDLVRQPRFPLIVNDVTVCTYVGDWQYREPAEGRGMFGMTVVEDRKGAITPAFKIKWALAKALHPEIEWRLS